MFSPTVQEYSNQRVDHSRHVKRKRISRTLGSISSPVMPGMLMSDRIGISDGSIAAVTRASASAAGWAKSITKRRAQISAKLLAKQVRDVGLVIDRQNQNAHA
jgi:hypothetical protein